MTPQETADEDRMITQAEYGAEISLIRSSLFGINAKSDCTTSIRNALNGV